MNLFAISGEIVRFGFWIVTSVKAGGDFVIAGLVISGFLGADYMANFNPS